MRQRGLCLRIALPKDIAYRRGRYSEEPASTGAFQRGAAHAQPMSAHADAYVDAYVDTHVYTHVHRLTPLREILGHITACGLV